MLYTITMICLWFALFLNLYGFFISRKRAKELHEYYKAAKVSVEALDNQFLTIVNEYKNLLEIYEAKTGEKYKPIHFKGLQ